jgi:3alpha(or 20beta)-hydroxysteroid dehydrogenase
MGQGEFDGKVAVITGGARGIGEAVSHALAAQGCSVIVADVNQELGRKVAADLGEPHAFIHLDVRDLASWQDAIRRVAADYGRLDILYLNAGVLLRPESEPIENDPLEWLTEAAYRKVIGVNVDGTVFGVMSALPLLEKSHGTILTTSSGAGIAPYPLDPVYTAAKFAIRGLSLALVPALSARGVSINVICPPGVDTLLVSPDHRANPHVPPSYMGEMAVSVLQRHTTGEVWRGQSSGEPPYLVTD